MSAARDMGSRRVLAGMDYPEGYATRFASTDAWHDV